VHRHILAKSGDLFWKAGARLGVQSVDPQAKRLLSGRIEPRPLILVELMRQLKRREARGVQNLAEYALPMPLKILSSAPTCRGCP
jgi:hypothetical protein